MKGVLCRAVIMSDAHNQEFGVEVNQDHPSMQEAMKQRPINRMALLAWIVAEIGKELPFHPELLRRVVPKRMLDNILGENDREQGRIVTRLLIDRACNPKRLPLRSPYKSGCAEASASVGGLLRGARVG